MCESRHTEVLFVPQQRGHYYTSNLGRLSAFRAWYPENQQNTVARVQAEILIADKGYDADKRVIEPL